MGHCEVCGVSCSQSCGGCKQVYYCSKPHQSSHWKAGHKIYCSQWFKVSKSPVFGRHLVATKDIPAGHILIQEYPLVIGPKIISNPVCLGCLKVLSGVDKIYQCSNCRWPLCGPDCESKPSHVTECQTMTEKKFRAPFSPIPNKKESLYCLILPLRCFLLNKSKQDLLFDLQSHVVERSRSNLYTVLKVNLCQFLRNALKLESDEHTILKVAAILDTNAFDVRAPLGVHGRGIYSASAMMAHDCIPNTKHYFTNDLQIVIVTTTDIPEGRLITTNYAQTLWDTSKRRNSLNLSKMFWCGCPRCLDPSEMGTHLSSYVCDSCKGFVQPPKCSHCGQEFTVDRAKQISLKVEQEIKNFCNMSIKELEAFLESDKVTKGPLHSKHSFVIQVKYALIQLYVSNIQDLSKNQMNNAQSICKDLLEIANVLEPGLSRFRGKILYYILKLNLSKTKSPAKVPHEMSVLLNEASSIWITEPEMKDYKNEILEVMIRG